GARRLRRQPPPDGAVHATLSAAGARLPSLPARRGDDGGGEGHRARFDEGRHRPLGAVKKGATSPTGRRPLRPIVGRSRRDQMINIGGSPCTSAAPPSPTAPRSPPG